MSAKKRAKEKAGSPSPEELHQKSMKEGRAIIEAKLGKEACAKIFSPIEKRGQLSDKEIELRLLDTAAEFKLPSLQIDRRGNLRNRDPELVDALAFSISRFSWGEDQTDKQCGLLILERIRKQTPDELKETFRTIRLVKERSLNALKEKNRAVEIIRQWAWFRVTEGRAPETMVEFAAHLVEKCPDHIWPSLSSDGSFRKWGKIWKSVGLSHRVAKSGKAGK